MSDLNRAKSIFEQALGKPEGEREGYVHDACKGDEELKSLVANLLDEHESAGATWHTPASPGASTPFQKGVEEKRPESIGPYKILSQIGEGGFGIVYLAEQTEPVTRRVALKVIKRGMESKGIIARFEAERQALALMDHPNVAKVLGAGETEDGRPYFVMDYVKGESITKHCDRHRLGIEERLDLFIQVCEAIQHAHHKGVIHRDLKPGNILVEYFEGKHIPRVIDFGIAKAMYRPLTEKTIFTEIGQLIGTPEYMSPEQAESGREDIDTRSDIYSLGVLLYELLTGSLPFDSRELRAKGYSEIQRIIREVEPPKPSTRLTTIPSESNEQTKSVTKARRTDSLGLKKRIRGDLDWIIMRCLEKDRARRYDTASALALEIRRYLSDQPVDAGPPSAGYRLRKFARRNRTLVATGSLVAAVLVVATIVSTWFGVVASRAADTERIALEQEREARVRAEESRAASILTGEEFVNRLHALVGRLEGNMQARQGLIEAAQATLGRFDELEELYGPTTESKKLRANIHYQLARIKSDNRTQSEGRLEEGETEYLLALGLYRELLSEDQANNGLKFRIGNCEYKIGAVHAQRGEDHKAVERFNSAAQYFSEAQESVPPAKVARLGARDMQAKAHRRLGEYEPARTIFGTDLDIRKGMFRNATEENRVAMRRTLSVGYISAGDLELNAGLAVKSLEFFDDAIQMRRENSEAQPDNVTYQRDVPVALCAKARAHLALSQPAPALAAAEEAVQRMRDMAGPEVTAQDTPDARVRHTLAHALNRLAEAQAAGGNTVDAVVTASEAATIMRALMDEVPSNVEYIDEYRHSVSLQASALNAVGQHALAYARASEALGHSEKRFTQVPENVFLVRAFVLDLKRWGDAAYGLSLDESRAQAERSERANEALRLYRRAQAKASELRQRGVLGPHAEMELHDLADRATQVQEQTRTLATGS